MEPRSRRHPRQGATKPATAAR